MTVRGRARDTSPLPQDDDRRCKVTPRRRERMRHWISTVVIVAAFTAVIASQTPSGHAVFEQALAKERIDGNLPEAIRLRSEEHTSELQSQSNLVCRLLLEKKKIEPSKSVRALW